MSSNKYQARPVLADILDNMAKIIEGKNSAQLVQYFNYLAQEGQYVEKYRKQIQPKLKKLIQKVKNSQGIGTLQDKIRLYESVIARMSDTLSKEQKEKLQRHYLDNQHKLANQNTKQCLRIIIRAPSILNDHKQSKREMIQILKQFKKYIDLDLNQGLASNLVKIKLFLMKIKKQQIKEFELQEYLTSTSLLLHICIQNFCKKVQISDYQPILDNIKIQILNRPLQSLIKTLNLQIINKSAGLIQTGTSTEYIDFRTLNESHQLMQTLPELICTIEDFINSNHSNHFKNQQLSKDYLLKLASRLNGKIQKYNQQSQKLKNVSYQLTLAQQQSQQIQKRYRQLLKEVDSIKIQLYIKNKQLQRNQKILTDWENYSKDKDLQIQKIKQISLNSQQDSRKLKQLEDLRQDYHKISRQKNGLLTQFHNLQHQLDDERAAFRQQLSQQLDRLTKFLKNQKATEIAKIDQRRRAQKSKLMAERQQLQNELIQLKEKYYNEIGAMLNRSRMDISICKSEKGTGSNILQLSNILNGLEQANEQDLNYDINQLQKEFKKQFQQEILKLNKKNNALQKQLEIGQDQIKKLEIRMKESALQVSQMKVKIENNDQKISSMNIQISLSKSKITELMLKNKTYLAALNRQSNENDSTIPRFVSYQKILFQGMIFDEDDQSKTILIKHITNYMGKAILRSRSLYEYNPSNKTNFHTCIDNKKGLLCLVKIQKAIIAGFYPGALVEGTNMNLGGLLISVTSDVSYPLMQNKITDSKANYRGMTYDSYYVVFGNAQLRIRTGENKVFSNFGIQNSYFDYQHSSRNVNEFLGEGDNREVQFVNCEFYQIFFEEQEFPNENKYIFRTF